MRIVTLNIWQEQGPHEARLRLIAERFAALAADVYCLQEVRQVPGLIPNQAETLADALRLHFVAEVAQPWGGGDEGLAVLSRHPIVERAFVELPRIEGRDSRRICLGAAVRTPGGLCWVFTTHLAYRLEDGAIRERQVRAADLFAREKAAGEVTILCGDFNASADADEMRYLRGLTSIDGERTYYQDAFAACNPGVDGATWSSANPYTRALGWLEPDRRLDYIYVSPMRRSGAGQIASCRLVCTEPDTTGIWCSDHFGVMAEVQVGTGEVG